jgi:pimeloyl-ACP methyl ester carboxylesterase
VCKSFLATLMLLLAASGACAVPCAMEDFETKVTGVSECLLMRRYGSVKPGVMMVWLHGNASSGGPVNSHFRLAEKSAIDLAAENVLSVALVRPGYPDGTGQSSSGSDNGRADNWPRATVAEIGSAIERLRLHYQPNRVVIAGHSGGAAITAVLLGMKPQLADAALLLACPCDLVAWRAGRRGMPWLSENPVSWIEKVSPSIKVIALTGSRDDTTVPGLARTYVDRLKARGIDASFQLVPDAGHIDVLRSPAILDASLRLLRLE